jgi:hypothetical protein
MLNTYIQIYTFYHRDTNQVFITSKISFLQYVKKAKDVCLSIGNWKCGDESKKKIAHEQ